ncbi:DUF1684 domain-containing protein [Paeniglutamicibacter antarcticus]|uniref:DUF1684 domain-containing protein n=1 Tax=Arthrobacter terrae TaxID=2935737 RepID=A0A931CR31_9MICC|nr:DUF1684 domain-containing protein [Arthrobacter terrae]MBG0741467.1 DUF1684 domain-containing protein [Arthrobacter terrae]
MSAHSNPNEDSTTLPAPTAEKTGERTALESADGQPGPTAPADAQSAVLEAAAVLNWRLQTFALYAEVREAAATSPSHAHALWRGKRDTMFAGHPASALGDTQKAAFTGLPVAAYDPAYRFESTLTGEGAGETWDVRTGTDGVVPFVRLGTFEIPGIGELAAWKLAGYGGGIFLPFRDMTAGRVDGSYGAGRYLLDTIKGAYLGSTGSRFILDFNFSYNPSCAYNEAWACPLPGPDNRLETSITAGEMYRSPTRQ